MSTPTFHHTRNLLITGIPRSGTSLLCRLLDDQADTVIVNEPRQALNGVRHRDYGEYILGVHDDLRRAILLNRPIENKVIDGHVITDTAIVDRYSFYHPDVKSEAFRLGTKNTLVYLSRLNALRHSLNTTAVICCIRDPWATISSWKRTFPHLMTADVSQLLACGVIVPQNRSECQRVEQIATTDDVRIRRALLWCYLAAIVSANSDWVTVIKYERLLRHPESVLRQILSTVDLRDFDGSIETSIGIDSDRNRHTLDRIEEQMIADICGCEAQKFGYG